MQWIGRGPNAMRLHRDRLPSPIAPELIDGSCNHRFAALAADSEPWQTERTIFHSCIQLRQRIADCLKSATDTSTKPGSLSFSSRPHLWANPRGLPITNAIHENSRRSNQPSSTSWSKDRLFKMADTGFLLIGKIGETPVDRPLKATAHAAEAQTDRSGTIGRCASSCG